MPCVLHHRKACIGLSGLAGRETLENGHPEPTLDPSSATVQPLIQVWCITRVPPGERIVRTADVQILAIPGSLRQESYNKSLLHAADQLAPNWMSISVYDALSEVPLFDQDLANAATPGGVVALRDALSRCDGVLIATPEYNQAVPGVVKNMIDWLSLGEPHEGLEARPVAVTGVTPGPWGTRLAQTTLRQMLVSTQAILLPQPSLYLRDAGSLFDESGELTDAKTRHRLTEFVSALGEWVRLLRDSTVLCEHEDLSVQAETRTLVAS